MLAPAALPHADWPRLAADAELTTICLHDPASPAPVLDFAHSPAGHDFLARCQQLRILVEYEFDAMDHLMPRELFARDPTAFMMNDQGDRVRGAAPCVHSSRALDGVAERAAALARRLKPATHRYFFWPSFTSPWCRCNRCARLSDSDQALRLLNHAAAALCADNPRAQVAYRASGRLLAAPVQVTPHPAVFLEFAPWERPYDTPLHAVRGGALVDALEHLIAVFGAGSARVLEAWLSPGGIARPLDAAVLRRDLITYGTRGVRHVVSLTAPGMLTETMPQGGTALERYGMELAGWQPLLA